MEKTYYSINEELARVAHMAWSLSDYIPNSTTNEYCESVDHIWKLVEQRKAKGDLTPEQAEKLEVYADRYARRYADWQNRMNSNTASCPSIMITGGSNFPVRKKEKQNAREDKLWEEYNEIKQYLNWVENYAAGHMAIMSSDADAVQQLEKKLADLTAKQGEMKAANVHWRKHGTMRGYNGLTDEEAARLDEGIKTSYSWCQQPYPGYELTNNNANIRRLKERLDEIKREKATEGREWDMAGLDLRVEENKEIMRLQVFFEGKPNEATRTLLKSRAFKWAPSTGCWQRQLTNNARYDLKKIIEKLKEVQK